MNQVTIRKAKPSDARTLLQLIYELADFQKQASCVKVTEETLRTQLASQKPPFECLLAEAGGVPAGYLLYYSNYSTWSGKTGIYLEDIFTCPQFRGAGIGKLLMERIVEIAQARGIEQIDWKILNWNASSIGFCSKFGAKPTSEWIPWRLNLAGWQNKKAPLKRAS